MQPLDPTRRSWHITFGTYATRLHSDPRATVDRRHNQINTPFPPPDPKRQTAPADPPVTLNKAQRQHIESALPALCKRGGWTYHIAAAPPEGDHVHVLLDAERSKPPKSIRQWLKRWLSEALNTEFTTPPHGWWADGGSTKPVTDNSYLQNVTRYIQRQRTTPQ
ncbi:MAG: transposase [Planctomycetota bacterium]